MERVARCEALEHFGLGSVAAELHAPFAGDVAAVLVDHDEDTVAAIRIAGEGVARHQQRRTGARQPDDGGRRRAREQRSTRPLDEDAHQEGARAGVADRDPGDDPSGQAAAGQSVRQHADGGVRGEADEAFLRGLHVQAHAVGGDELQHRRAAGHPLTDLSQAPGDDAVERRWQHVTPHQLGLLALRGPARGQRGFGDGEIRLPPPEFRLRQVLLGDEPAAFVAQPFRLGQARARFGDLGFCTP